MLKMFKNLKVFFSILILGYGVANFITPALSAADAEDAPSSASRTAPTLVFGRGFSLEPIRGAGPDTVAALKGIFTEKVSERYENGQPWSDEKAKRKAGDVGPRVQAWEEGDNESLPWTLLRNGEEAIGVILAAYNKNKKRPKQFEIAAALKEVYWGQGLALSASMVYAGVYVRPLLDECEGVYATVHPDNQKSIRAMKKTGFVCESVEAYYPDWAPQEERQDIFYRLDMFMPAEILRAHIAVADEREYAESCVSLARQEEDEGFARDQFGGITDEPEEFGSVVLKRRERDLAKAEKTAASNRKRLEAARETLARLIAGQAAE